MELKVEEYGRHLFSTMLSKKGSCSKHWESIRKEAEPLVRQLIRLNEKMNGGGYKLVGYIDESGKQKLPDYQRIKKAQEKLWKVKASKLKKGDLIWLLDDEPEMHVGENQPGVVDSVTKECVYLELQSWWELYIQKIEKNDEVLRAPNDWKDNEKLYSSDKYWLKQADELKI